MISRVNFSHGESSRISILTTAVLATSIAIVFYLAASLVASRRLMYKLRKAGFPMPKYHPIFGHLLTLKKQMDSLPSDCTTNTSFLEIAKEFPNGIFYFDLSPFAHPMLIVATVSGANQLTQLPLDKPHIFDDAFHHLTGGPNLLTMPQEPWKVWRSLFNPAFSASYMLELVPAIVKEAQVFCNLLEDHSQHGEVFQLEKMTIKLTIDIIGAVTVDSRWNYQVSDHPLASALRKQIEWTTFKSEMNPWDRYHPLRPFILWHNGRRLTKLVNGEIQERYDMLRNASNLNESENSAPKNQSKSIVTLALKEYLKDKNLSAKQTLDPSFLKTAGAQLRLFLFAGHDTTSSALIYCYHGLFTNPSAIARLRAEHDSVLGPISTTATTLCQSPHLLNSLPYTLACIKESLRLFPPASAMRAGKPDINVLSDDGTAFPTEGCWVWAVQLLLHRSPNYWVSPHEFLPERWLVGPEDPLYPPKGAWRPFEFGPRSCLGQTLAINELKVVLALTARRFNIRPAYDTWDKRQNITKIRTVLGERAYQVEGGGGGAHPSERYPCTVSVRT